MTAIKISEIYRLYTSGDQIIIDTRSGQTKTSIPTGFDVFVELICAPKNRKKWLLIGDIIRII